MAHNGNISLIYIFGLTGFMILLLAGINFVNLSTALAVTRSKEVGIRKVMGSSKAQLKLQVFIETAVVVLVSALVGLMLAWLALNRSDWITRAGRGLPKSPGMATVTRSPRFMVRRLPGRPGPNP